MDQSLLTHCDGLFCATEQRKTATEIPLLFKAPDHRLPRIYVQYELSLADKSLRRTAKTSNSGARAPSTSRCPPRACNGVSLSAPGGGEGRGEVGDSRAVGVAVAHLTFPRLSAWAPPSPP